MVSACTNHVADSVPTTVQEKVSLPRAFCDSSCELSIKAKMPLPGCMCNVCRVGQAVYTHCKSCNYGIPRAESTLYHFIIESPDVGSYKWYTIELTQRGWWVWSFFPLGGGAPVFSGATLKTFGS